MEGRAAKQRMREVYVQNKVLKGFVGQVHAWDEGLSHRLPVLLKLSKLAETTDIEAYLTTFARLMTAYEINRAR